VLKYPLFQRDSFIKKTFLATKMKNWKKNLKRKKMNQRKIALRVRMVTEPKCWSNDR
jgi:hypothetical protein